MTCLIHKCAEILYALYKGYGTGANKVKCKKSTKVGHTKLRKVKG